MKVFLESTWSSEDYCRQAQNFLIAAQRCFGEGYSIVKNGEIQQLPVPCVVNAAFSCEMSLKALLHKDNIQYDTKTEGHDLFLLFKKLSIKTQNAIAKFCGSKTDAFIFEQQLKKHAKDFIGIRYFIEHKGWTEISPMEIITIAENLLTIVKHQLASSKAEETL